MMIFPTLTKDLFTKLPRGGYFVVFGIFSNV